MASSDAYLSELLTYSLERLNKEPELLAADAQRIQRQQKEVSLVHYSAYLAAAGALTAVTDSLTSATATLARLEQGVPALQTSCEDFGREAAGISARREATKTILAQHSQLTDLLEIPSLMDTCVRNGNFDEALDMEAFIAKLASTAGTLPVVSLLVRQTEEVMALLLDQLLGRLRANIQLPECLRVIGYLRRLNAFSERGMRLQFLSCREAWLVGVLETLELDIGGGEGDKFGGGGGGGGGGVGGGGAMSSHEFLKRIADVHRVQLFDIVMQYRAIFADDVADVDSSIDEGGLLYGWALHRIQVLVEVVRVTLPSLREGSTLAGVLEHYLYCGISLGRVGLDFRPMLPPLFEARVAELFAEGLDAAMTGFVQALSTHRWIKLPSAANPSGKAKPDEDREISSPHELLDYPPLAVLLNGILSTLNDLRQCAPPGLRGALAPLLQDLLMASSSRLVHYHATHSLDEPQTALLIGCCKMHVDTLIPHVVKCFGKVFPGGAEAGGIHAMACGAPLRDIVTSSSSSSLMSDSGEES